MSEPTRWRDDPQTLERLGLDLEAERGSLHAHDLRALKAGVEAKIASGATASVLLSTGWGILLSGLGVAILVGAGLRFARPEPGPEPLAEPPVRTPFHVDEVRLADETPPTMPPTPGTTRAPLVKSVRPSIVPARAARDDHPQPSPVTPPPALAASTASTDLADQIDRYERGQAALRAGDATQAADIFSRYLATYPGGRLRVEAEIGLLEARVQNEAFDEAARLADRLARDPLASHRRREILRVLGESRVMLGRCEEARAAFVAAETSRTLMEHALARCSAVEGVAPK